MHEHMHALQVRRIPNKDQNKFKPVKVVFGLDREGCLLYEVVGQDA